MVIGVGDRLSGHREQSTSDCNRNHTDLLAAIYKQTLKDTALKQYLYDLDRRLDRIMAAVPVGEAGRKLHKRMLANRAHLFVFMTNRAVPPTNNISERHLRPSVIFRKVTNGFRCEWGAETYAAFRSVVSTAKANRASVLDTVRFVISAKRPGGNLAGAG